MNAEAKENLKQEVFEYLDHLREKGITNMFGATPYVQNEFALERKEARELLGEWMATFSERHPE